ncbi:MAG TPA: hypothetical protein VL651_13385, partial [Bacteroidia bacterium]|nr:hypothetical protein [Bacteroidia bacterium]
MRSTGILFFLLFPLLFHAAPTASQEYLRAKDYLGFNKTIVTKISTPVSGPGRSVIMLETPFALSDFVSPVRSKEIEGHVIEKIQLVYTTFAVSSSFDQQKLNLQRLTNLYKLLPEAFSSAMTEWELVGQSGATSPETGRTFFHGFIIYFREAQTSETTSGELNYISGLFYKDKLTHADSMKLISATGSVTLLDGSKMELDRNIPDDSLWRYVQPSSSGFSVTAARWADLTHDSIIVQERSNESGYVRWRHWKLEDHFEEPTGPATFHVDPNNPDTAVLAAFRKNNWKNAIIVTDVTGSMSPYTAQVLATIPKLIADQSIKGCIFFNDGDGRKNSSKNVGSVGGIYPTYSTSLDSIMNEARDAMKHGDGGDLPENDVEAVLYAINKMNPQGDIILIADNLATPRDLELVEKIGRPVHIILCGARGGINPDYLFLARATHGSIHTTTVDIYDLDKLDEGNVITI